MSASASDRPDVDRRSLLRRGGVAVAAGVAGVAAGQFSSASSADADAGAPLVLDAGNDGGSASTSLTAALDAGPTFEIANTGIGASLRLTSTPYGGDLSGLDVGDLTTLDGNLYYTADGDGSGDPYTAFAYTALTASQIAPIHPQRVLDTRTRAGRANIVTASGNLDTAGRLRAGRTIVIRLDGLVVAPEAAFCNLTVVTPVAGGHAILWPGGARPDSSSVNFGRNATVANFAVTGVDFENDTVAIYTNATTHVLLDVTAFSVGSWNQINPRVLSSPANASRAAAVRARRGAVPHWYRGPVA